MSGLPDFEALAKVAEERAYAGAARVLGVQSWPRTGRFR
jgi:hypothetical protein